MVQISAGFLGKVHNMLGRMRVLAVRISADKDIKPYKK